MSSFRVAALPGERQRVFLLLLGLGLFLSVLGAGSWAQVAQDPVGRIIRTLGVVEAIGSDGAVRRLGRQDPIFEGDTLRTGARGRVQIRFTDRGLMSLRPSTELVVDDYEFDEQTPNTARQALTLSRGGFRAATGRVADGNRAGYRVNTPLAVIGVRGTVWNADQSPGGALTLGVEDGGIDATTVAGRTASLGAGAGFNFARINADGSVDYLVEPPAELATSAELDDGEGDDSDGDGDDGDDLGDAQESSVGSGEGSEA
ncbi:MAG: FecR family protein, partial [Pseudomonadales bacterium]|nr:FecR family protein [Pseudomonadales bacterium]